MRLTDELKEHTRSDHHATEKKMISALKQLRSKEDYIQLLYTLYGFYSPMEERVGRYLDWSIADRRSDALLRDIMDSGLPLQHHADCHDLPVIDSFASALGAHYVLAGSAMGGRRIAGMIQQQIGLRDSLSFFTGEGEDTDGQWQTFKDYLNQSCFDKQRQEILSAAQATFITFKNWIDKNELQPQL